MSKKNLLKKVVLLGLVCGNILTGGKAWADAVDITIASPTSVTPTDYGGGYNAEYGIIWGISGSQTIDPNVINSVATVDGGVAATVYGITLDGGNSISVGSLSGGITIEANGENKGAFGIGASVGEITIQELGNISATVIGDNSSAAGIGNESYNNSGCSTANITFADGANITVSASSYAFGIYNSADNSYGPFDPPASFTTSYSNIGNINVSADNYAFGYQYYSDNSSSSAELNFAEGKTVTVTGGGEAYGLCLQGLGTVDITKLGGITAETTGNGPAFGIYVDNFNTDDSKKIVVEFATNDAKTIGGTISAYSASGENYGIKFDEYSAGKVTIENVKSITAGVKSDSPTTVTSGNSAGIFAYNGNNSVEFVDNSGIDVKSQSSAYGICTVGGTLDVTGLGGITVAGKGDGAKLAFAGGTLNLINSTVAETEGVTTIGCYNGSSVLNLDNSKVSGPLYVGNDVTFEITLDENSELHITESHKEDSATFNVKNDGKLYIEGKDIIIDGVTSTSGSAYYFVLTDKVGAGDTMLDLGNSMEFSPNDTFTITVDPSCELVFGDNVTLMYSDKMDDLPTENINIVNPFSDKLVWTINSSCLDVEVIGTFTFSVIPTALTGNVVTVTSPTTATINGEATPNCDASNWYNVYGGYSKDDDVEVSGNKVVINAGSVIGGNVYGGYCEGDHAEVTENKVIINSGAAISGNVYGGYCAEGTTDNNAVVIGNGIYNGAVYGGYSKHATSNALQIIDGNYKGDIYGGYALTDEVSGNSVNISGGTFQGNVYGGRSFASHADGGNLVSITGGTFNGNIYGGYADGDCAGGNIVNISGGTFYGDIYGSYVKAPNQNNGNAVIITGGTFVETKLIGGIFNSGPVVGQENTLVINTKGVDVKSAEGFDNYAFVIPKGMATTDSMLTTDTELATDGKKILVGLDFYSVASGTKYILASNVASGTLGEVSYDMASGNEMSGSSVNVDAGKLVYTQGTVTQWLNVQPGALSNNQVKVTGNQTATVNGGTQNFVAGSSGKTTWQNVYGGYSIIPNASVSGNRVTITGGAVEVGVYGGYSQKGEASNNTVVISPTGDFVMTGGVYGGCAERGNNANNNTVVIAGSGDFQVDSVYGGCGNKDKNNTVEITRNGNVTITNTLYGGSADNSNNTLILGTKNVKAVEVNNFQNYVFNVPANIAAGETMLKVTSDTDKVWFLANNTLAVNLAAWDTLPTEAITLIDANGGFFFYETDVEDIAKKVVKGNNEYDGTFNIIDGTESQKLLQLAAIGSLTKYVDVIPNAVSNNTVVVNGGITATINGTSAPAFNNGGDTEITNWLNVYGGYSEGADKDVINNKITITGTANITGNVYGGYSKAGNATGNTVTWESGTIGGAIYGGNGDDTTKDFKTGNTLVIKGKDKTIESVNNFSEYTFDLDGVTDGDFMLSVTTVLTIANETVNITNLGLGEGETVTLISNVDGVFSKVTTDDYVIELSGINLILTTGVKNVIPTALTSNNIVVATPTTASNNGTAMKDCTEDAWRNAYGGYSDSTTAEDVTGNNITITGTANITGNVYGGYSKAGNATSNTVIWESGTIGGALYGGNGDDTNKDFKTGNTLVIKGKDKTIESINNFQNYTFNIPAEIATDGSEAMLAITGDTALAFSTTDVFTVDVTYVAGTLEIANTITLLDSAQAITTFGNITDTNKKFLNGGQNWAEGRIDVSNDNKQIMLTFIGIKYVDVIGGAATGNTVTVASVKEATIENGGITTTVKFNDGEGKSTSQDGPWQNVYGSWANSGDAGNNAVNIQGGTITDNVCGGYSVTGNATGNTVTWESGTIGGALYGGNGDDINKDFKTGNTLVIKGSGKEIKSVNNFQNYEFDLTGVTADAIVLNITGDKALTFDNGDKISVKVGDMAEGDTITLIEEATGTFVWDDLLANVTFATDITDWDATDVAEYFKVATDGKSITFTNAVLDVDIKPVNKTSGNIVTVTGDRTGTVEGETIKTPKEGRNWKNVYGGYAETGDANDNKVTITAGIIKGNVYGGYSKTGNATGNFVTWEGGTIGGELYGGYSGAAGKDVGNNWLKIVHKGETKTIKALNNFSSYVFDINAAKNNDTVLKITGKEITLLGGEYTVVVMDEQNEALRYEGTVCLVEDAKGIVDAGVTSNTTEISDGIVTTYGRYTIEDGKKLIYTKTSKMEADDGAKAPVEGMASAATTVNTSSDLATGAGMGSMIVSTSVTNNADTFGATNIGKARYNTGSHVDASGYGIVVGVGKKVFDKKGNKTTGGLFFEYGNSNFDTYNANTTGSGKSIYKGGGYMMRWDNLSGNYYEGMIHAGKITTNWSNNSGGYNMNPTYYGAAATYGHKFMFGEKNQLSVYGSYIYSHTGGGDAMIGKYNYNFDATKSHRTKVGVRYAVSDLMDTRKFRPYVGLAWEHEFNGESGASVVGFGRTAAPSMKGDTGILELGFKQEVGKWTLGIGAEVFTGKRRGWNGTLQAMYNF